MLGLSLVLHHDARASKTLPPRVPPKRLSYSSRSLSSSSSSSSSTRYSSSPSPVTDPFNSPLFWPSSAAGMLMLEQVREEDDLGSEPYCHNNGNSCSNSDPPSSTPTSPSPSSCSTLRSSPSSDQGRPPPPSRSPLKPYAEKRNPAATPTVKSSTKKTLTPLVIKNGLSRTSSAPRSANSNGSSPILKSPTCRSSSPSLRASPFSDRSSPIRSPPITNKSSGSNSPRISPLALNGKSSVNRSGTKTQTSVTPSNNSKQSVKSNNKSPLTSSSTTKLKVDFEV